jgi:translation initiation factor IF-2
VHELAKELNLSNKDLIERILKLGHQVKNHMSTLSDAAVQAIREHLDSTKAQVVEEKRIGRTFIRRRKKLLEEMEPAPALGVGPPGLLDTAVVEPGITAVPAVEVPLMAPGQTVSPGRPPEPAPEFLEAAARAPLPAAGAVATPEIVVSPMMEEPAGEILGIHLPPAVEPPPAPLAPELDSTPAEAVARQKVEEAAPVFTPAPGRSPLGEEMERVPPAGVPLVEVTPPPLAVPGLPGEAAAEEETEEKPKRAKKRRRKKARREEPARIIKLPELIPEELEEDSELPTVVSRLGVDAAEDLEREQLRKRKAKPAEAEEPAPERKRAVVPGRKEVVEREDLYSKKELAAQADRERGKGKGRFALPKEFKKPELTVPKAIKRRIRIEDAITLSSLAKQIGIKAGELIKKLLLLGLPASINQAIDFDTAALLAADFDFEVEKSGFEEEGVLQTRHDLPEDLLPRPPVVTVMGHVDHGKTSLLDAIRHTNVIEGEAGGITQHIGAYYVKLDHGDIVFLDTPGHEAFTAMRARGAKVTDIVILVVAADDGVMQQTVEAINHAKAANVPIIVAVNKIDKPQANVDRVKRELADHGLVASEWGGDVTMVEVSAKKNIGIEELLEMVLLQAELMELRANPTKTARGHVIEAKLDKGRGPVATILIQEGTLRAGDVYVCGIHAGRVRSMFNDRGQRLEQALPSVPVEVIGFSGVPNAGDDFIVLGDEKQAKLVAEHRLTKQRERELTRSTKITLEKLYEQISEGAIKELNVILRADVQGSLEAIGDSLVKLSSSDVKVNIVHSATGAITETDVMLASASNAIVIGFNVRADAKVQEMAEQEKVDVRYYDVIYQIINDIRDAMLGMLEPEYQENVLGRAEVRQTFNIARVGTIAGCYVLDGRLERAARVRVLRDQVVVYDGKIGSLKRFKDDVKEAKAGFECGIGIENFNDIKVNDVIEAYELQAIKPTLASSDADAGPSSRRG